MKTKTIYYVVKYDYDTGTRMLGDYYYEDESIALKEQERYEENWVRLQRIAFDFEEKAFQITLKEYLILKEAGLRKENKYYEDRIANPRQFVLIGKSPYRICEQELILSDG